MRPGGLRRFCARVVSTATWGLHLVAGNRLALDRLVTQLDDLAAIVRAVRARAGDVGHGCSVRHRCFKPVEPRAKVGVLAFQLGAFTF